MVKPVIMYGSQILGYKYRPEIETVQLSLCNRYLSVKHSTNNCIVLWECGGLPLCISYM